ncbi:MAG TPA: hypothetical protein VGN23_04235 [Verrucomicrobiae bacterium]
MANTAIQLISLTFILLGFLKFLAIVFPKTIEIEDFLKFGNAIFPFIPNAYLLAAAAIVEVLVGWFCLQRKNSLLLRSIFILWFSAAVLLYEMGLVMIRYRGPCGCLLGINRIIPIQVSTQNALAQDIIIASFLITSAVMIYARRSQPADLKK